MNKEYKKGFIEAINGVLGIINNIEKRFEEEKYEENDSFPYELKKIENAVLGLKISFFENYYENAEEPAEIEIDDTEKPPGNYDQKTQMYKYHSLNEKDKL